MDKLKENTWYIIEDTGTIFKYKNLCGHTKLYVECYCIVENSFSIQLVPAHILGSLELSCAKEHPNPSTLEALYG